MTQTVESYDFDQDAMGLGDFITAQMKDLPDDASPVVYVEDGNGGHAYRADWVTRELTDGSKVCELRIFFAEP